MTDFTTQVVQSVGPSEKMAVPQKKEEVTRVGKPDIVTIRQDEGLAEHKAIQQSEKKTEGIGAENNQAQPQAQDTTSVQQSISKIEQYVQNVRRELHMEVDEATGEIVVHVIDPETDEVIRRIPIDDMMNISKNIADHTGLIFNTKV